MRIKMKRKNPLKCYLESINMESNLQLKEWRRRRVELRHDQEQSELHRLSYCMACAAFLPLALLLPSAFL